MKTRIDPVLRGTLLATVLALSACASMQAGTTTDAVGKALVIHAGEDDLQTDPAGASGARQACGVISKQ
jgi:Cu/Zn superoxide dismutase